MRLIAAALLTLTVTPASAYWICFPVSSPSPAHHVAHYAIHRPTLRHHHHKRRICHVHVHCIWVPDGGPSGSANGPGGFDSPWGGGYSSGAEGEGDASWFPMGGSGGDAGDVDGDVTWAAPGFAPPYYPTPPFYPLTPSTPAVPEPATWAMFSIGMALIFGVGRNKSRRSRVK